MTQPTLSNGIAQLETTLGNKLFHRNTREVSLTSFGETVIPKLEKLLIDSESIMRFSKNWETHSPNEIRIGISPVVNMRLLQEFITPFKASNPEVEFFYQECYLDELEGLLKKNEFDIIIMPPKPTDFPTDRIMLYSEPLYYVPAKEHMADSACYQLHDIATHKLILTIDICGLRDVTKNLFREHNIQLNEYQGAATSYQVVEEWVEAGIGSGILPKSKLSKDRLPAKPLMITETQPAELTCYAYSRQDDSYDSHIKSFISHLSSLPQTP